VNDFYIKSARERRGDYAEGYPTLSAKVTNWPVPSGLPPSAPWRRQVDGLLAAARALVVIGAAAATSPMLASRRVIMLPGSRNGPEKLTYDKNRAWSGTDQLLRDAAEERTGEPPMAKPADDALLNIYFNS
jgi:hypothetical protein